MYNRLVKVFSFVSARAAVVVLLFNLWTPLWSYSQVGQVILDTVKLQFEELGVHQGLSAGLARRMLIDKQGFLWIGTGKGLNKYDGYNITVYKHRPNDSLSMPVKLENYAVPIYNDASNNLWLYNRYLGAYIFKRSTESFWPIDLPLGRTLIEDEHGLLWSLSEGEGWFIIDPDCMLGQDSIGINSDINACIGPVSETFRGIEHELPFWPENNKYNIAVSGDQLWMVTEGALVSYSLDYNKGRAALLFDIPLDDYFQRSIKSDVKVFLSHDHKKVYLISSEGYCEIDGLNGYPTNLYSFPEVLVDLIPKHVDSKNRMWITCDEGLKRVDLSDNKLTTVNSINSDNRMQEPIQIMEDDHENLWLGTVGNGVFKFSIRKERFKYVGDQYHGPPSGRLMRISGNRIAMQYEGLLLLDRKTRSWITLVENDTLDSDKGFNTYHGVDYLSDGQFWYRKNFNTESREIVGQYWINEDGSIESKEYSPVLKKLLISDSTKSLTLHFSVLNDTLYSNDIKVILKRDSSGSDTFSFSPTEFMDSDIYDFCLMDKNKLWLTFANKGLFKLNLDDGSWKRYNEGSVDGLSLRSDLIYSILPDPVHSDSILWLGSSNGLIKMDIAMDSFYIFTEEDGLVNEVIYGILSDHRDNLWLSTNGGLSHYNLEDGTFKNFNYSDGLQHNEFNRFSYVKDMNGLLYFGGMGGLTYFDPKEFYEDYEESYIAITKMYLNGEEAVYCRQLNSEDETYCLEKPLCEKPLIELKSDYRLISFEFSVLDFNKTDGNNYRYKLEGFDNKWLDIGERNTVTFTNLSPGTYTLRVQGANYDGRWNTEGDYITFSVLPFWWQTWWFRGLSLFVISFLVYSIIKGRIDHRNRIVNLRNQISKDLHDEIGSTLSSISLFGMVASKKIVDDPTTTANLLDKIGDATTSVMESMNDIVWAINAENDRVRNLIHRMRAYLSDLVSSTNWSFTIESEEKLEALELDMVQRRNTYLIFKEAVTNALKHSGGNEIMIRLRSDGKQLILEIRDNGSGFESISEDLKMNLGGNGLKNMRLRAEELNGSLEIVNSRSNGTKILFMFEP